MQCAPAWFLKKEGINPNALLTEKVSRSVSSEVTESRRLHFLGPTFSKCVLDSVTLHEHGSICLLVGLPGHQTAYIYLVPK